MNEQHKKKFKLQKKENLRQKPKFDENPEYKKGVEPNKYFEPCIKGKFDVNAVNNEVSESKEIITEKRDPMIAERIYEKNFNTDLKSIKDEPSTVDKRR